MIPGDTIYAIQTSPDGQDPEIRLRIRVTPKASRNDIAQPVATATGWALKVGVRAAPENGAANRDVIKTVAKWLSLPKSSMELSSGRKSRTKTLRILTNKAERARIATQLAEIAEIIGA